MFQHGLRHGLRACGTAGLSDDRSGTTLPDVIEAEAAKKPITHGLRAFTLKPKGLKGLDLFNHMQNYARKHGVRPRGRWLVSIAAPVRLPVDLPDSFKLPEFPLPGNCNFSGNYW